MILKRAHRKQDLTSVRDSFQTDYVWSIYSRVNLFKFGFVDYMRSHDSKQSQTDFTQVLQQQPTCNSCQICDKVYGSAACLRSLIRVLVINVHAEDYSFFSHICGRSFKNEFCLGSHMCFQRCFLLNWKNNLLLLWRNSFSLSLSLSLSVIYIRERQADRDSPLPKENLWCINLKIFADKYKFGFFV